MDYAEILDYLKRMTKHINALTNTISSMAVALTGTEEGHADDFVVKISHQAKIRSSANSEGNTGE